MKLKKWWVIALIMILPLLFIMGNLKKKTIETAENNLKHLTYQVLSLMLFHF